MRLLRITTVPISLHLLLKGQFQFMREHGFEVMTASADGPEVEMVREEGVKHAIIPMSRRITPLRDLYCLWLTVRLIRRFRPEIVHTHTPKAGLLGMLAAWFCRVPVRMHTVAGIPFTEMKGWRRALLKFSERITYACAHRVCPNSAGLMNFIGETFPLQSGKLKMIAKGSSNGIDVAYFSPAEDLRAKARALRAQYAITDDTTVFCYAGRIVGDKGVNELVAAFKEVGMDHARLILVGPFEEERDRLKAATLDFLKKDKQVVLAGFQSDVRPWMLAADVFVLPSYREGFPNVVLQACCLGVPCIVSDINGCNEIIRKGVTGTVVPPKDIPHLAQAMKTLANDAGLRKAYAEKAREFVATNFQQQVVWEELLKEYEQALAIVNATKTPGH